jgi:hypothetical protein
MDLQLMILTADPIFAIEAQNAGIDRIFFDLEYINKAERQKGRNAVLSENNIDDIPNVHKVLTSSELLVRTNPIHQYSKNEIDKAIEYGAKVLMLPMVFDAHDVQTFINYVDGRAKTCIMIETAPAMTRIDNILELKGIDEIFIGLNDLHIGLGLSFMFEPLSGGLVEFMANKCNRKGIPFGFGGIAKIGDGILPADKILAEHVRLGSQSVILSRAFKEGLIENQNNATSLKDEVKKIRDRIEEIKNWNEKEFESNRIEIKNIVNKIAIH